MSEKITSTLDSRIASDVEARNRVQTQMEGLLAKEGEAFTADDLAAVQTLQAEFDGLTERIEVKQKAAESAADKDFTGALLEETAGMAQAGDIKPPSDRTLSADEAIFQNMADNGKSAVVVPMTTKLRGAVVADLHKLYQASPTMKEIRQLWMGQASPLQQDVIGRIAGTGAEAIGRADHSIIPQGVEATFVEVLRNINGPHRAGCEMWFTADLAPVKLPKAVPFAAREPGTTTGVPAERGPDDDIADNQPEFTFVNTQVREYSALFPVDRSVENTTPAMVGSKVGELLARQLGAMVSQNATVGAVATTAEGVMPSGTVANQAALPAWLYSTTMGAANSAQVTNAPTGGVPTYATIMSLIGALQDFPTGGGGDVWMAHKSYVFSSLIGMRGTDGHPIFKSMGIGDTAPVDTLMGRPIVYCDYSPAANTNERLMAVYGNFYNGAICRRAGDIELATDMSGKYFARNQVAYRGIMYEAFVVKNANQFSYLRGTT